jgi:rhodanese-related sulfurtransferase
MTGKVSTGCGAARRAGAWAAVALGVALALAGCGSGGGRAPAGDAAATAPAGDITPADAHALIAADTTLLLLDVRTPAEWNDRFGHLDGSIQIPIDQLAGRLGELERWKDRTIITVCTVGQRSGLAARLLAERGFRDARNLRGGLQAWRAAGY